MLGRCPGECRGGSDGGTPSISAALVRSVERSPLAVLSELTAGNVERVAHYLDHLAIRRVHGQFAVDDQLTPRDSDIQPHVRYSAGNLLDHHPTTCQSRVDPLEGLDSFLT